MASCCKSSDISAFLMTAFRSVMLTSCACAWLRFELQRLKLLASAGLASVCLRKVWGHEWGWMIKLPSTEPLESVTCKSHSANLQQKLPVQSALAKVGGKAFARTSRSLRFGVHMETDNLRRLQVQRGPSGPCRWNRHCANGQPPKVSSVSRVILIEINRTLYLARWFADRTATWSQFPFTYIQLTTQQAALAQGGEQWPQCEPSTLPP